jgi:short-subunit dehydrogenase
MRVNVTRVLNGFGVRYGPWAVIAGASEGIGAAFARAVAARGVNLVLVARRPAPLAALAATLPVETITVTADLATGAGLAAVIEATAHHEVGLVVANAALAPLGPFVDADPAETQRVLDLNCGSLIGLAHHFLPPMVTRGRGGLIVMSSASGLQGGPSLAVYAASKAFGAVFAEGLWWELRGQGVDVTACIAGAVAAPDRTGVRSGQYVKAAPRGAWRRHDRTRPAGRQAPGTVAPEVVVAAALRGLGRGPRVVPGSLMRISVPVMARLLPRRRAIALMARAVSPEPR